MSKKKYKKLQKIRAEILGIELCLSLLEQDLEVIQESIARLFNTRKDLIYNINLHRTTKVITMISEYGKSITELSTVDNEISKYTGYASELSNKINNMTTKYEHFLDEYDYVEKQLNNESVILLFKKGKHE